MPDILIHDYCKKDFEDLLELARYGANNAMIGVNMKWEELPPHGDLILKDDAIAVAKIMSDLYPQYRKVLAIVWDQIKDLPVIVPAERGDTDA